MMLKTIPQLHFDHLDRHVLSQRRDHVGTSSDKIVGLLGSVGPFGTLRLEIDTGQVVWSGDASRIHRRENMAGRVSLSHILATYHPEDVELVEQVASAATSECKSFRLSCGSRAAREATSWSPWPAGAGPTIAASRSGIATNSTSPCAPSFLQVIDR